MNKVIDRKFCVAPMMGYTTPYARKLYRILSKKAFLFRRPLRPLKFGKMHPKLLPYPITDFQNGLSAESVTLSEIINLKGLLLIKIFLALNAEQIANSYLQFDSFSYEKLGRRHNISIHLLRRKKETETSVNAAEVSEVE